MRYSSDKNDEGYQALQDVRALGKNVFVYLDGDKVEEVFTVDTEIGYIHKYCQPLETTKDGDKLVTEGIFGNVTIEIK